MDLKLAERFYYYYYIPRIISDGSLKNIIPHRNPSRPNTRYDYAFVPLFFGFGFRRLRETMEHARFHMIYCSLHINLVYCCLDKRICFFKCKFITILLIYFASLHIITPVIIYNHVSLQPTNSSSLQITKYSRKIGQVVLISINGKSFSYGVIAFSYYL